MKKSIYLIALACTLLFSACTKPNQPKTITNSVTLEGQKADMSAYEWIEGEPSAYEEIPLSEVTRLIQEGGSGIIYFGYNTCQWCARAIPELDKVVKEYGFVTYYVDLHSENYTVEETDVEAAMQAMDSVLMHDDAGEPLFYVPLVMGVKNGEIVGGHTSLVGSYHPNNIDDPEDQMSEESKAELQNIYKEIIEKTIDD